jgi:glycosyltransferase involved in cell wall biosynthesis
MKTLQIIHLVWSGAIGGTENFAFDLAVEQARRHKVGLGWMSVSAGRPARVEGLDLREFGMRGGYDVRRFARVLKWVKEFGPDIIHVHDATPLAYWAGLARPASLTMAHVHTIGNPYNREGFARRFFLRLSAVRIVHYIANSRSTRDKLMVGRGVRADMISTVPNAVDLSRFDGPRDVGAVRRALGIPEDAPVVGFVGRLHPAKGVDLFLETAAAVRGQKKDIFFVIVGNGRQRDSLERRAQALGVADRLRFAGERQDVPRLLSAFDVFVSTSRVETFGIAILEAMAAGVPVVAFAVDAVPELLATDGVLIPPGDIRAAASAVCRLMDDPSERERLSEAAYKRVRTDYSIQRISGSLEELYFRFLHLKKPESVNRDTT